MGNVSFALKLKKARVSAGFTQKDIYERLGISQSTFSSWETGKSEPDADTLVRLCNYYGIISLAYFDDSITQTLPTPAGQRIGRAYDRAIPPVKRTVDVALEPYMDDKAASMGTAVRPDMEAADIEVDMTELPVYDQPAAAGYGNYLDDDIYEMISFPTADVPRGTDYCVRISGDSMEPEIEDGDIVYVREALTLDNGDIGIFRLDNEAYCKKFTIDHRRREVRLVSVNEGYEDIPIEGDVDFRIIGRVLGVAEQ